MSFGKLIFLLIVVGLGCQQQVMVAKYVQSLKTIQPLIMTYIETESFRGRLTEYAHNNEGRLPQDIGSWLNQNFKGKQKSDMSLDFFGAPYQVVFDRETARDYLLSCGPDRECHTDDDIAVKL